MPKIHPVLGDLSLQLEPPHTALKEQILDTLLENPFLDEDLQGLSMRLGAPRETMVEALDGLCQAHVLRSAGKRGYVLDMVQTAPADPISPQGSAPDIALVSNLAPALLLHVFDAFPTGALLLDKDGRQIAANERMADLLEIPRMDLDGETFTRLTGIGLNPADMKQEIQQVLDYPSGVEVIIRSCAVAEEAEGMGVFIVARKAEEVLEAMQAQALFQEELFEGLRAHLIGPLMRIEQFLENPESGGLAPARAALERVNWFLGDLFLAQKNDMVSLKKEDHDEE